jgi:two-component system KDP operon response regulator KdpE
MADAACILVVEDDAAISRFLCASLSAAGYQTLLCITLSDALVQWAWRKPDLIVLDLGLPDGDGKDFLHTVRQSSDVPVIVLSARQAEAEKVDCLDCGADDYLSKPFGAHELLARVRVILRRISRMHLRDHVYELEGLSIDLAQSRVTLGGQAVHLTPIEYKLLALLASMPGRVFTHRQLLVAVWGESYLNDTHYLRIHMGRLRAKLEQQPAAPRYILTEAGTGYRLAGA